MNLKSTVGENLLGYTLPQEYLCLASEKLVNPLRAFLTISGFDHFFEVTNTHILLGYKPLVIGIVPGHANEFAALTRSDKICISFLPGDFHVDRQWLKFLTSSQSCARLILEKIIVKTIEGKEIFIYKGIHGEHQFLSTFHQWANLLTESFKALKKGNVFLPGNLYEQVRIAYAVPREISIISVGDGGKYNMFPTDLHGSIDNNFYMSSLRHGGLACKQVQESGSFCLSSIGAHWHEKAYALGKNHMKELSDLDGISCIEQKSEKFNLPLPEAVISYRELRCREYFDIGVHRVFFYDIINAHNFQTINPALFHIHRYYAQWRMNNNLETEYLLR